MSDLWPDFCMNEESQNEKNTAINILREQARFLGQKLDNKVKATFSKMKYKTGAEVLGISSASSAISTFKSMNQVTSEEVLEDDLTGKTNISDILKEQKYKFEIYNEKYRFRLFVYTYSPIYPNKLLLDENIAKEIEQGSAISVESDQQLKSLLRAIFSCQRVRRIIQMMIAQEPTADEKKD